MSNATREAAEVPLTAFKLALEHGGRQPFTTYHRFSGRFTFDEVSALVSHLWGGSKRLVVAYTDDEGDEIVVTSGIEWSECLRLHHETSVGEGRHPLLLRVKRVTWVGRSGRPASRAKRDVVSDGDANEDEEEDAEDTGSEDSETSASIRFNSASARLSKIQALRGEASAATREQHADPVVAAETEGGDAPEFVSEATHITTPKTDSNAHHLRVQLIEPTTSDSQGCDFASEVPASDWIRLLSAVFHCDAATILDSEDLGPLSAVASRDANGDVCVDAEELKCLCLNYAQSLSTKEDADTATNLLKLSVSVMPSSWILKYSLARVHARANRFDEALDLLEHVVVSNNSLDKQLFNVRDFDDLRTLPRFLLLAGACDETSPSQPAARPAVQVCTPRTATIHSVFPRLGLAEVRGLLHLTGGDVKRAVDLLL